ncbi:YoaK family protein [Marinicellulosiphila megalodicopiae]|uniref:YoaK family protein n=1 Tax=Marinicellulosiphila megalodicopiae TaxID=2724896 RepID=UPI003BB164E4
MGFQHQAISHLSGTATLLGTNIFTLNIADSLHLTAILLSFLIGSAISGFFIRDSGLKLDRRYSMMLCLESALLFGATLLLSSQNFYGHFLASAACGLQNALATTYTNAIIRTTHVTGIFTDLGIMFGRFLKGEAFDKRKVSLFLLIIFGFILGGIAGAYLFYNFQFYALSVPAILCIILALIYLLYLRALN